MKRLLWVAVGAGLAVVVARRSRAVAEHYLPPGAADALGVAGRVTVAARTAVSEFRLGLAEREEQLRHDLIGDVDIEALRADRDRARAESAFPDDAGAPTRPTGADRRARRASRGWADQPTEDPDDGDGDLPYSFA